MNVYYYSLTFESGEGPVGSVLTKMYIGLDLDKVPGRVDRSK